EFPLGQCRGRALVRGKDLQPALTDFGLAPVASEHILHEADDELRHAILPAVWTASLALCQADLAPAFRRDQAPQSRRNLGGEDYGTSREKEAAVLTNASILMIGVWLAGTRAGSGAGVRQACGGDRDKSRESTADPRRRRAQQ